MIIAINPLKSSFPRSLETGPNRTARLHRPHGEPRGGEPQQSLPELTRAQENGLVPGQLAGEVSLKARWLHDKKCLAASLAGPRLELGQHSRY